nr:MAG TPA: hypothetical protein [Caudoviricetes sp.]
MSNFSFTYLLSYNFSYGFSYHTCEKFFYLSFHYLLYFTALLYNIFSRLTTIPKKVVIIYLPITSK